MLASGNKKPFLASSKEGLSLRISLISEPLSNMEPSFLRLFLNSFLAPSLFQSFLLRLGLVSVEIAIKTSLQMLLEPLAQLKKLDARLGFSSGALQEVSSQLKRSFAPL